ncbi:UPF0052-domain-containing protein [Aureobasidium pullulans]|uniref:UPF0052-domain-containing protein n=1 Tax=Aureobasidium pullulans TaxID=5580 RepID=A0AB74IYW0_AURPU|nr:UPF0052-domain-containing protein [Aureobasidium pullulans]
MENHPPRNTWPGSLRLPSPNPPKCRQITIFGGGTATNHLVDVFTNLAQANNSVLNYIIPISDNGGSSSELIRVFGGPGIGDLRSRLVRLIPDNGDPHSEASSIKELFNHRLPPDPKSARLEWLEIVESLHPLWRQISTPKKELIRSFLNLVNQEIVKRMRPSSRFDFSSASIGNLFLTGARLFSGSLESAIYLLSSVCSVPETITVLPAINTNFSHHISVSLTDGSHITGQNNISHPPAPSSLPDMAPPSPTRIRRETEESDNVEDANLPGSLPSLRKPAIKFSKLEEEDLPSRIERLWYINPYGQEMSCPANPRVLEALSKSSTVIYSIGSLFTSIIPSIILRGVGQAIASPGIRNKILILNSSIDRETGPASDPFTAIDFIAAIADACAESRGLSKPKLEDYWVYISHVIYIESKEAPKVDREILTKAGIEGIRLYGQSGKYDDKALEQALKMVLGKGEQVGLSRRNTLQR